MIGKKQLSNFDATILACLAQIKYHSLDVLSLQEDLSCEESKEIARAILEKDPANKEAMAWVAWGESL